jgi:UDP-N-acetylmuramate--L-alanine ligase
MLNLDDVKTIYFVGIGGIGMSATAGIAKQLGFNVSGSDSQAIYDPAKSVLDENEIEYKVGYSEENIRSLSADLYIVSSGETNSNPEVNYLEQNHLSPHSLSELLGALAKDQLRVVVAGTHGKSTTAGLLGKTLQSIDNSSFMTGAVLQQDNTNFHVGTGHYFVFEGDEYKALYDDPTPKFHQYKADILLLTNLEWDHPDIFASFAEMENEFEELISNLPEDGLVVYNADSAPLAKLMHRHNAGQVSFGMHTDADFVAEDVSVTEDGTHFTIRTPKGKEDYRTNLFGEINVYNALGVIALLRTLGFNQEQVQTGVLTYHGAKRRLELIGEKDGVTVYDDYAHHPTAVREALKAVRVKHPRGKIWAVFEPHTFSRTKATLSELSEAFGAADQVLLAEIYPAREQRTAQTITGQEVVAEIQKRHNSVRLVGNKTEAQEILKSEVRPDDVVVVMAVGDFNLLAHELMV